MSPIAPRSPRHDLPTRPDASKEISDALYQRAIDHIVAQGRVTQKDLKTTLGLKTQEARALMQTLEDRGAIGPAVPGKPREIFVSAPSTAETTETTDPTPETEGDRFWKTIDHINNGILDVPTMARELGVSVDQAQALMIKAGWEDFDPEFRERAATLVQEGDIHSPKDLAQKLSISPGMANVMLYQLIRQSPRLNAREFFTNPSSYEWTGDPDPTHPSPWWTLIGSTTTETTQPAPETSDDSPEAVDPSDEEPSDDVEPLPEDAPPAERLTRLRQGFADLWSRFKGEAQKEDEATYQRETSEYIAKGALWTIERYASLIGYKGLYDVPAWMVQKAGASLDKNEIKRLLANREAILEARTDTTETPEEAEIKAMIEQALEGTKRLTQEKRAEVIQQLQDIYADYQQKERSLRKERDEHVAKLLDEHIKTRIAGSTALKEGINTALMASGLLTARLAAYSLLSARERYMRVSKERARGEREGSQMKEWAVGAFTETWSHLKEGTPALWRAGRFGIASAIEAVKAKRGAENAQALEENLARLRAEAPNALKGIDGVTTVLKGLGMTELAIGEMLTEGDLSSAIDNSLELLRRHGGFTLEGVTSTAAGNLAETPSLQGDGIKELANRAFGGEEQDDAALAAAEADVLRDAAIPDDAESPVGPDTSPTPETQELPVLEITEAQLDTGTVTTGDGIIEVLMRHGVDQEEALSAARELGIIRAGGDTRLSTEAIGRISIFADVHPDGEIEIDFIDTETGDTLTLDELREQGLVYESGAYPGAIVSEGTAIDASLAQTGALPGEAEFEPTPDLPHVFNNGRVELIESSDQWSIRLDTHNYTEIEQTQLDGIVVESAYAELVASRQEQVQLVAQDLIAHSAIIERLEQNGLEDSAEMLLLQIQVIHDLQQLSSYDAPLLAPETLQSYKELAGVESGETLDQAFTRILSEYQLAESDPIPPFKVKGFGEVEFSYKDGELEILQWKDLVEKAPKSLDKDASELLIEDWEFVTEETIENQSERTHGGPILLLTQTLKVLYKDGHEGTPEAEFIKQELANYIRTKKDILNADHPVVKEALELVDLKQTIEVGPSADAAKAATAAADMSPTPISVEYVSSMGPSEPIEAFRAKGVGKIKFDHVAGHVTDARWMNMGVRPGRLKDALAEWDLTKKDVQDYTFKKYYGNWSESWRNYGDAPPMPTSPEQSYGTGFRQGTDARPDQIIVMGPKHEYMDITRSIELLARQENMLEAMRAEGLEDSNEYKFLQEESAELRTHVEKKVREVKGLLNPSQMA